MQCGIIWVCTDFLAYLIETSFYLFGSAQLHTKVLFIGLAAGVGSDDSQITKLRHPLLGL
jgi:hypothetical protein